MISKAIDKIIIDFLLQMNRWFINHVMFVFAYVTSNTISPIYVSFLFIFFSSFCQSNSRSFIYLYRRKGKFICINTSVDSIVKMRQFQNTSIDVSFFYYYYQEHICSPIFLRDNFTYFLLRLLWVLSFSTENWCTFW